MLYLLDFNVEYSATQSQKDLFQIWAREADAALGANVPVMNTRSNRLVQTVVRGPGLVAVIPAGGSRAARSSTATQRTANAGPTTVR